MWLRNFLAKHYKRKKSLSSGRLQVPEIMNATGAKNRTSNVNGAEHFDIEVPDTAHQISSGLSFVFSPLPFIFLFK